MKTTKKTKIEILLPNLKCPSWNELLGMYWAKRSALVKEMKDQAFYGVLEKKEIKKVSSLIGERVTILVEASFKNPNRRDPDNLYVKPIIDGLVKSGIFEDDSSEFVESVTLTCNVSQKKDFVRITIIF